MAKKQQPEQPRHMTRRALSSHKKAERRQRFIFFGGVGIISVVVIIVFVGLIVGEILPNSKTVLNVGGRQISYGYYVDALKLYTRLVQAQDTLMGKTVTPVSQINTYLPQIMQENMIVINGAEELDVTVGDDDVKERLELYGLDANDASMDYIRVELLTAKLKEDYFGSQVPDTMLQVRLQAILLESAEQAAEVRPLMAATDNISEIAAEYDLSSNAQDGDFGWHPEEVFRGGGYITSELPVDYAFGEGREAGDLSQPISDNESSKKIGYWLLRVNEITEELASDNVTPVISANVSGLLLGSRVEAGDVRQQLIDGALLEDLATEYSQYSVSRNNGGELGMLEQPETDSSTALSEPADAFIFSENTTIGTWSEPIADTGFTTTGGAWLVRVADKDEGRSLDDADRQYLINSDYNTWFTEKQEGPDYEIVNVMTAKQQTEAIAEVEAYLASLG